MMTHSHLLVGAALFAGKGWRGAGAAALAGALVPDLDVATMWLVERAQGVSSCVIFRDRFWQSPWVEVQGIVNSAPLWAALTVLGFLLRRRIGFALLAFAAAGFLHVIADFLLHADDARAHWRPFTKWRFYSPVSYWDPAHFGHIAGMIEALLGLTLVGVIWRRFTGRRARVALGCVAALYGLSIVGIVASSGRGEHSHDCVAALAKPVGQNLG